LGGQDINVPSRNILNNKSQAAKDLRKAIEKDFEENELTNTVA
jgi:hypothetical protein